MGTETVVVKRVIDIIKDKVLYEESTERKESRSF